MRRPDNNNPASAASVFRRRRFAVINRLLREIIAAKGSASIVDVGGRRAYWDLLSRDVASKCTVTLINLQNELDIGRPPPSDEPLNVHYLAGDGCDLSVFPDASFDLAHSNSVIEHVGSLSAMARFASELRRVGSCYYVQTPYLWFPIEPHYGVPFVHWLPAPARAQLLHRVPLGYASRHHDYLKAAAAVDHTQIVDITLMRRLFPDGVLIKERVALLTKSLVMIRRCAQQPPQPPAIRT